MGTTCLLDTNTVIYFLDALLPVKALDFIEETLDKSGSYISVINKIELLGWQAPSVGALRQVETFVHSSIVLPLTDDVVNKSIEIRQNIKIKLPDAVVAATAIIHDCTLISRNDADFLKVPGLKYLNTFTDI
jgi:predicted nucleic acid-binding protein